MSSSKTGEMIITESMMLLRGIIENAFSTMLTIFSDTGISETAGEIMPYCIPKAASIINGIFAEFPSLNEYLKPGFSFLMTVYAISQVRGLEIISFRLDVNASSAPKYLHISLSLPIVSAEIK